MTKIIDYKVQMDDSGDWHLFATTLEQEQLDYPIKDYTTLESLNAIQIREIADEIIRSENLVIVKDKNYMVDQKVDLNYVRVQMRKIIKNLASDDVELSKKKEMLDVYGTICNASNILTKTCALELAIDKIVKQ